MAVNIQTVISDHILIHFFGLNFVSILHSLGDQILSELLLNIFYSLRVCYRHIKDVSEEVRC